MRISTRKYKCIGGPWNGERIVLSWSLYKTNTFTIGSFNGYYEARYNYSSLNIFWVQLGSSAEFKLQLSIKKDKILKQIKMTNELISKLKYRQAQRQKEYNLL